MTTPDEPRRCPFCGATEEQHDEMQQMVNLLRGDFGLPALPPPDIETGYQRRTEE